jgi:broad specificity polyphosphatase/5'/3'-nucleotidase SurE
VDWAIPALVATRIFPLLAQFNPREGGHFPLVLNVNVPRVSSASELRGIRQTILADIFFGTVMRVGEVIPNGRDGHRLRFAFDRDRLPRDVAPHFDHGAIKAGYVSVTPLAPVSVHPHLDLEAALAQLRIEGD